jgi:hypothetical protein
VRLALSRAAADDLSEFRVRRVLDIELPDGAILAQAPVGPLDDRVAYVWIHRPTPARLDIEVRLDGRAVVRRRISASGLTSDVAARLVAIAASEMIRTEMRKARSPRRSPAPRRPTPEELELASRDADALTLVAAPHAAVIAGEAGTVALAGSGLGVGFRHLRATPTLFARWLGEPTLRWLEAGLSVDHRFWLGDRWRLSVGGVAALAALHLPFALTSVDGIAGQRDTWSARAGLGLGLETRVAEPLWLGLSLEPGVVLRPVLYEDAHGARRAVEGAWLGVGLTLAVERRDAPAR